MRQAAKPFIGIKVKPAKLASNEDEFLTREEVAKFLKISGQTVDAWRKKGCLTGYYLGVNVRFIKSEVVAAFVAPIL